MQRNPEQLRFSAHRQAFTLVELLVVCTIIAMLASLTLIAVRASAGSAKVSKTRATLQKLDTAMQQIFETYEDKFAAFKRRVDQNYPELSEENRLLLALHYVRDTMRMEMPQCWEETLLEPLPVYINGTSYPAVEMSPLLAYYQKECEKTVTATQNFPHRSALLFLIIQNLNPEALSAFHGSEVADTDGDGLPEFVDAWGSPIQFLRWAPALTGSDLQQNVWTLAKPTAEGWLNNLQKEKHEACERQPCLLGLPVDVDKSAFGWFLYPLIYSAGPDKKYGLDVGNLDEGNGNVLPSNGEPLDPYVYPCGMPDGTGDHFDNIHNHRWFGSF